MHKPKKHFTLAPTNRIYNKNGQLSQTTTNQQPITMLQFEKLLRANEINENDPELPRAITKQIQLLRIKQKSINADASAEDIQRIEDEIDEIDNNIMKTLPEFFEIEDEEEINKQKSAEQAEAEKRVKAEAAKKAKEEAEQAEAEKRDAEAKELSTPANNDDDALDKLFRRNKLKVTEADLKAMGFNTGFWGNLTPHGCETQRYKLLRNNISIPYYEIVKK